MVQLGKVGLKGLLNCVDLPDGDGGVVELAVLHLGIDHLLDEVGISLGRG